MRRAIVHVGMPRTGTTSLQHVLTRLRPALAERGVLYPDLTPSGATPHLSHQHLGEALDGRRSPADRAALLARLDAILADEAADTILLSYESLILIPDRHEAPATLAALFRRRGFAMEIALTVKPQAAMLASNYAWRCQFLREGRDFAGFVRSGATARQLDPGVLLPPWAAPATRVTATPLREARASAPLVTRFLREIDLGHDLAALVSADDATLHENPSPGPLAIEAMRRLRRAGAHLAATPAREITRFVEIVAREHGDATAFRPGNTDLRARLHARHAAANDALARLAWGERWSDRVAEEPVGAVTEIAARPGPDPGTEAALAAILARTYERFGMRPLSRPGLLWRTAGRLLGRILGGRHAPDGVA